MAEVRFPRLRMFPAEGRDSFPNKEMQMTLQEWKDQMAERFTGRFTLVEMEEVHVKRVRHATRLDVDGKPCCPIVAFSFDEDDDYTDCSNRCADLLGIAHGLSPEDVERIMDASDGSCDAHDGTKDLRAWMDAVLVHGRVYEA